MYENFEETKDHARSNETCTEAAETPGAIFDLTLESEIHEEKTDAVTPNLK